MYTLTGLIAPRGYYYIPRGDSLNFNYKTGEIAPHPEPLVTNNNDPLINGDSSSNYGTMDNSTDPFTEYMLVITKLTQYKHSHNPDSTNAPVIHPYHLPNVAAHLRKYMVSPFAPQTSVLSYTLFFAGIISQALNLDEQDPNEHLSLFMLIFFLAMAVDIVYPIKSIRN